MSARTCNAIGCARRVPDTALFCDRHLPLLQSDVRTVLERTYRPAARHQSHVFTNTLQTALNEILYAETEGNRAPRDAEFEWSDD